MDDDRNYNIAKNLILFIGDGMGMTTVTTARILRGQKRGHTGEENELAFDKFEYVALSKVDITFTFSLRLIRNFNLHSWSFKFLNREWNKYGF